MNISTKLVAGFVSISLLAALIGITGLYSVNEINETLNNITDVAAPTVETSDDLIVKIFQATTVAEEIIADEDLDVIDGLVLELEELNRSFDVSYEELSALVTDEALVAELETAKNARADFIRNTQNMIKEHVIELEKEAESVRQLEAFDVAGSALTAALDEFAEENEAEMAKAEEQGDVLEAANASGREVNEVLGLLFDQDYPVVEAALKLQRLVIEMQDTAGEYLAEESITNLRRTKEEFEVLYAAAQPHIVILRDLAETQEDREDAARIQTMLSGWRELAFGRDQLFETHRDMLEAEHRADELTELLERDTDVVAAALDRVAESADAISDGADEAAAMAVDQARTVTLLLLTMASVLSLGLLTYLFATVVRPIKGLTDEMNVFGSRFRGNQEAVSVPGDEIAKLRAAFDNLSAQVEMRTQELEHRGIELDSANKELEEELRLRHQVEQQLVHAQKLDSLGTLAGGIAHDFNNMLYVILGGTQMALEDLTKDDELRATIERIDAAAQRSKSIVNQILFFSRQDLSLDLQVIDFCSAATESVTLLHAGLPATIRLETNLEDDGALIQGDRTQIQQVIVNLVTNAYQSYPDRKGDILMSVKNISVGEELAAQNLALEVSDYVCLTVEDKGMGISEKDISKIFDPFFTTKAVGEGTGLGLAVVHGIVTAHRGAVLLQSKVGVGTTFQVFIPAYEAGQMKVVA